MKIWKRETKAQSCIKLTNFLFLHFFSATKQNITLQHTCSISSMPASFAYRIGGTGTGTISTGTTIGRETSRAKRRRIVWLKVHVLMVVVMVGGMLLIVGIVEVLVMVVVVWMVVRVVKVLLVLDLVVGIVEMMLLLLFMVAMVIGELLVLVLGLLLPIESVSSLPFHFWLSSFWRNPNPRIRLSEWRATEEGEWKKISSEGARENTIKSKDSGNCPD